MGAHQEQMSVDNESHENVSYGRVKLSEKWRQIIKYRWIMKRIEITILQLIHSKFINIPKCSFKNNDRQWLGQRIITPSEEK